MDGLAKTVLTILSQVTHDNIHVVNYRVVVKLSRHVALISHLPITLLIFMDPFQQMVFLLDIH